MEEGGSKPKDQIEGGGVARGQAKNQKSYKGGGEELRQTQIQKGKFETCSLN